MKSMNPERLQLVISKYVDRGYKRSPTCGSDWHPGKEEAEQADTLQFQVGPMTFTIVTRSTYSIYQFLGKLLRQASEANEQVPGQTRKQTNGRNYVQTFRGTMKWCRSCRPFVRIRIC
jgi:hypothetical protein